MTAAVRRRNGQKSLAALLFPLSLVLALSALDEPTAVAVWNRAAEAASDAWGAARGQWEQMVPARSDARTEDGSVLQGAFDAVDDATRTTTGDVAFVRAELRFATGGLLKTRPHRIAFGRDAAFSDGVTFGRLYGAEPRDQIELRQVLAGSTAVLCQGAAPGWIGLRQKGERVTLIAFRAGPSPGPTASPEAPCAVLNYRR
jgi:hypothetical protein